MKYVISRKRLDDIIDDAERLANQGRVTDDEGNMRISVAEFELIAELAKVVRQLLITNRETEDESSDTY